VPNAEVAIRIAVAVWEPIYGVANIEHEVISESGSSRSPLPLLVITGMALIAARRHE